jgi:DNA helicase-2/ATP-dependent DNA helicase PcrA
VHSVKGLEFEAVIILDCINGIFPNADEEGSKEDNEELRCFYVALTRAKERLYFMCPMMAMRYGQRIHGVPARYLNDSIDILTHFKWGLPKSATYWNQVDNCQYHSF